MPNSSFPVFDSRDGRPHENLKFKTFREILGFPLLAVRHTESGREGREVTDAIAEEWLTDLIARAKGQKILAASIANFGVTLAIAIPEPKSK